MKRLISRSMLMAIVMLSMSTANALAWSIGNFSGNNIATAGNNYTAMNATATGSGQWQKVSTSSQNIQLFTQAVRGQELGTSTIVDGVLNVNRVYTPSGWMPGNDQGTLNSVIDAERGAVQQMTFNNAGDMNRWTGLYWQAPANNWSPGSQPGYDLTGATTLTFWARGEKGGETVDFMIGGDQGNSFRKVMSSETLSKEWTKYSVDLSNADLSNVGWGFGVKILPVRESSTANSGTITIYLDDINYQFNK